MGEGLQSCYVVTVEIQNVNAHAQLIIGNLSKVTLRTVSDPVDSEVVTVALVRTLQLEAVAIKAIDNADQEA